MKTHALIWVAACVAAAALAGCGGGHALHRRPPPPGTPVVSIPELGSLSYRCSRPGRLEATLTRVGAYATESATVEGDGGRHLRAATLNPPGPGELSVPAGPYRTLTWRMIESTEPRTLEATVRLSFSWAQDGYCSLGGWTSAMNVIGHQGPWSPPKAWP